MAIGSQIIATHAPAALLRNGLFAFLHPDQNHLTIKPYL
jgi:hypothetical protein